MTDLIRTDPTHVLDVKRTDAPRRGQTASGYGGRIPAPWMIRYVGDDGRARWHRVYVMVYGNGGAAYITANGGRTHHLDTDTEHRLTD